LLTFPCFVVCNLDAVGTKRFDSDVSGDREVQRTMLELLNQLDGFSTDDKVKVSIFVHFIFFLFFCFFLCLFFLGVYI
jgi:hypothetical protein